jgi:hypothetical protein
VRATEREIGGSLPIARYFARQASSEGFELDDEIPTLFKRFEVVWPLDVAHGMPLASELTLD